MTAERIDQFQTSESRAQFKEPNDLIIPFALSSWQRADYRGLAWCRINESRPSRAQSVER